MDWLLWPWETQSLLGDPPTWAEYNHERRSPGGLLGGAPATLLGLWLIELIYTVVAEGSSCKKCGADLRRRITVIPSSWRDSSWRATVAIRCSGWRRHRHLAEVAAGSKDLVLGPFHLS